MTCEGITGGSGSYDVHSINFYKLIAQSQADINKDGKIEGEQETSIFNDKIKEFDMDKNGKLDDNDVRLFKSERTVTPEENRSYRELKAFMDENNVSENNENLSREQRAKAMELEKASRLDKRDRGFMFEDSVFETLDYLFTIDRLSTVEQYLKSTKKYLKELVGLSIPSQKDTNPPGNFTSSDKMYLEQFKKLSGQKITVKQNDGTTVAYEGHYYNIFDDKGHEISNVYIDKESNSIRVSERDKDRTTYYNADGNVIYYEVTERNGSNYEAHTNRTIYRSADGSLIKYEDTEYNEDGFYTGSISYDANGEPMPEDTEDL